MIKKTLLIAIALLFMTACAAEEQSKEVSVNMESQSTSKNTVEAIQSPDEPMEEESIEKEPLNLVNLEDTVWNNKDESVFVHFIETTNNRIEFRLLQTNETAGFQEHTFIADVDQHEVDSWNGTLTSETAQEVSSSQNTDVVISYTDDLYKLSVGDIETLTLKKASLTLEEWIENNKTLKELSDDEVIRLIQSIETQSAERFASGFTETTEGYSFHEDFQSILSSVEHFYTDSYQSDTLRMIYNNPIYMIETLHSFPLADTPVLNFEVFRSFEQLIVYTESEYYGSPEYTRYSLNAEDKEWKINSRSALVSPEMAKYGTLAVSGEIEDSDAYAKLISTPNFNELVQMIQDDERYYVTTHLDYDDVQVDVWFYQVDPLTGAVYSYDRVLDRADEVGSLFDIPIN